MRGVKGYKLKMASVQLSMMGRNARIDQLPLAVTAQVQELRRARGMSYRELGYRPQGKRMCRADLALVASRLGYKSLRAVSESDILWDEVVSLEADGCEEVFDLAVPGLQNFVVSNIFAHNSGAIEQDADVVMFLYRDGKQDETETLIPTPLVKLLLAKQRNGPVGEIDLIFHKAYARFDAAMPSHTAAGPVF
jgi:replicative DNA helicase